MLKEQEQAKIILAVLGAALTKSSASQVSVTDLNMTPTEENDHSYCFDFRAKSNIGDLTGDIGLHRTNGEPVMEFDPEKQVNYGAGLVKTQSASSKFQFWIRNGQLDVEVRPQRQTTVVRQRGVPHVQRLH